MELFYDFLAVKSEDNPYNHTTTEELVICKFYKNSYSISVVISKSYQK